MLCVYSIAPRIPPGLIEGSVPGRFPGSVGFPQGSLGGLRESPGGSLNQGELEREIQDELEREIPGVPGRPRGVPGGRWGVPGGRWGFPGGSLGVPGGSRGVPGGVPGRPRGVLGEVPGGPENTSSFLRVSGGGPGGPLG